MEVTLAIYAGSSPETSAGDFRQAGHRVEAPVPADDVINHREPSSSVHVGRLGPLEPAVAGSRPEPCS